MGWAVRARVAVARRARMHARAGTSACGKLPSRVAWPRDVGCVSSWAVESGAVSFVFTGETPFEQANDCGTMCMKRVRAGGVQARLSEFVARILMRKSLTKASETMGR